MVIFLFVFVGLLNSLIGLDERDKGHSFNSLISVTIGALCISMAIYLGTNN